MGIDIDKVAEKLGIHDIEPAIKNVLDGYYQNVAETPKYRKGKVNELLSALKKIDEVENQTLVLKEIMDVSEAAHFPVLNPL